MAKAWIRHPLGHTEVPPQPSHTHTRAHTHELFSPFHTSLLLIKKRIASCSFCVKSGATILFCSLLCFHSLSLYSLPLSPFPLQNITDSINFSVKCNFIARCLLRHDNVFLRILSMWKQSKVSYFRGSCIFYLTSSSPLWKETEESKNTFSLVRLLHAVHVSQAS